MKRLPRILLNASAALSLLLCLATLTLALRSSATRDHLLFKTRARRLICSSRAAVGSP